MRLPGCACVSNYNFPTDCKKYLVMVDTSPGYSENIVADKAFADLGAVVATFFSLVIRQEGDIHKTSVIFQVKSI